MYVCICVYVCVSYVGNRHVSMYHYCDASSVLNYQGVKYYIYYNDILCVCV